MIAGSSTRSWLDDYPIYRLCRLFVIGGGQGIVGEDIAAEINAVRERCLW